MKKYDILLAMNLIDCHAHLDEFADLAPVLRRAADAGVTTILGVGIDTATSRRAVELARDWGSPRILPAAGLHPTETTEEEIPAILELIDRVHPGLAAIGEIGLDYHYTPETGPAQRALFERQVALAAAWELPVVIHSREADADTLAILRSAGSPAMAAEGRLGVLHCFTGDRGFAEDVLAAGLCISFSGILTFRNADALREVARHVPEERLLIETDCPYLTPVPVRGQPNEPAFVKHVARCLAKVRGMDEDRLAALAQATADRLFTAVREDPPSR